MAPFAPKREIWIVDDSPLDAERARLALERRHAIRLFKDGAAALEALSNSAAPDVLILDWMMPGVSGIEVCQFLRSARSPAPNVAILLLTARQKPEQVVEGLSSGANDYLVKPYADEELIARVEALLRTRELIERLGRAEENVRRLLVHAPDALLAVDRNASITFLNDEAGRIFNIPPAALIGKPIASVLPDLSLHAVHEGGPLPDVSVGDQLYSPTVRVLPSDFAASTTIALRNVTAVRHAEARRLDFYSIIAHDLRSPLGAILLRTDLMIRGGRGPLTAPVLADLRKIEGNIRSLVSLINDFLDLARLEGSGYKIEREPIDLALLARQTIEDVQPLLDESRLAVTVEVVGKAELVGDRRRLMQVLGNLLSNAIKFTPAGGRITLEIEGGLEMVTVRVIDTGRGIAPEVLPTLFQRYARGRERDEQPVSGTGLGLMIVREIVEAHGGTVGVDSQPGRGSRFWFRLPIHAPSIEPPPPPQVLLIDDDENLRESMRFLLEAVGYTVAEAANGHEGLQQIQRGRPRVVIVDLNMAVMTGWEFISCVQKSEALADLPICVISAQSKDAPADVARVLQKPIAVPDLLDFVAKYCREALLEEGQAASE